MSSLRKSIIWTSVITAALAACQEVVSDRRNIELLGLAASGTFNNSTHSEPTLETDYLVVKEQRFVYLPRKFPEFFTRRLAASAVPCKDLVSDKYDMHKPDQSGARDEALLWTAAWCGNLLESRIYASDSLLRDPANPLFWVSSGMLSEWSANKEGAAHDYGNAIALLPGITASRFFLDLKKRSPDVAFPALNRAEDAIRHGGLSRTSTTADLAILAIARGDNGACEAGRKVLLNDNNLPQLHMALTSCADAELKNSKEVCSAAFVNPGDGGLAVLCILSKRHLENDNYRSNMLKAASVLISAPSPSAAFQITNLHETVALADDVVPARLQPYVLQTAISDTACADILGHKNAFKPVEWREVGYLMSSLCSQEFFTR